MRTESTRLRNRAGGFDILITPAEGDPEGVQPQRYRECGDEVGEQNPHDSVAPMKYPAVYRAGQRRGQRVAGEVGARGKQKCP